MKCLRPAPKDRFSHISKLREALFDEYSKEFKKVYELPQQEKDDSAFWWFNRGWAFHNIGRYASAEKPYPGRRRKNNEYCLKRAYLY